MPSKTTSVRPEDETQKRVRLMAEDIGQYVEREEWFIREVEKGVKAADDGRLVDHADVKAKWEVYRLSSSIDRTTL